MTGNITVWHNPKKISDIKGQEKAIAELKEFIENFPKKKAVLLYGKTGTGKTASVVALANDLNLELVEINASDFRNKDGIESTVGTASMQMSLFKRGKIILVDEIDGLSGTKDRGGIPALVDMIETSGFPVIMTANDPFDQKFSTLRKKAKLIEFHTLSYITIANVLKDICKTQKIEYDDESINALACRASGDLRSAIIDLFILSAGSSRLSVKDMDGLFDRKRELSILDGVTRILKTTDINTALSALEEVDEDLNEAFLWIDENLPKEYKNPEDIEKAYNALSKADVFNGRIKRWQYWRFLVYVNFFLTAGVAMAKKDKYSGFSKIERPGRILKMWISNAKNDTKKKIAQKLSKITHKSAKYSFNVVPFIQIMCQQSKEYLQKIVEELKLDEKMQEWLMEKTISVKK